MIASLSVDVMCSYREGRSGALAAAARSEGRARNPRRADVRRISCARRALKLVARREGPLPCPADRPRLAASPDVEPIHCVRCDTGARQEARFGRAAQIARTSSLTSSTGSGEPAERARLSARHSIQLCQSATMAAAETDPSIHKINTIAVLPLRQIGAGSPVSGLRFLVGKSCRPTRRKPNRGDPSRRPLRPNAIVLSRFAATPERRENATPACRARAEGGQPQSNVSMRPA